MNKEELFTIIKAKNPEFFAAFEKAPASTKWHGAKEGGLMIHSINVYVKLVEYATKHKDMFTPEDCVKIAFLHDLCKANLYIWDDTLKKYTYDKELAPHHAKRSVELINSLGIELTTVQKVCILLHMGAFINDEDWEMLTTEERLWLNNCENYKRVAAVQWADMKACEMEE